MVEMEQLALEGIADAAYGEAKLDVERPHVLRLARRLLGDDAIERGPRPVHGPAALVRVGSAWRIMLARSLSPLDAIFATGHELGHWLLAREGYDGEDEERVANRLGAALVAPRRAFLVARRAFGDDLPALASALAMTETGAALRLGEVLRVPLAVVSPALVRVRGPEHWVWPHDGEIRRWTRRPVPGVRKTRLRDDPRRTVLDVEDAG